VHLVLGIVRRFPFLILVAALAVGGLVFREHLVGAADALRAGDCVDLPAQMREFSDIQHRPCAEPHDAEVFLAFDHPADRQAAFLSQSATDAYVIEQCVPAFEAYTGRNYRQDPDYDIGYFQPTAAGWGDGDRGFTCYLFRMDSTKTSGSLKSAP
jgi:hypothetical protein